MKIINHQRYKPTFWKKFLETYITVTMFNTSKTFVLYITRIESEITKRQTRIKLHGSVYNTDYTNNQLSMIDASIIKSLETDISAAILIKLANEEEEEKKRKADEDYANVPF